MTSREQFNCWFQDYTGVNPYHPMSANIVERYWAVWVASRNVEIKLPDKVFVEDEFDKGHNFGIEYCAEAIVEAGFRVKGG